MPHTPRRVAAIVGLVSAVALVSIGLRWDRTAPPMESAESVSSAQVDMEGSRLVIPDLDVIAPLSDKPSTQQWDPFLGTNVRSFGVPDDMTSAVRWSGGPEFSEPGMAVILGHTRIGGPAVFNSLATLSIGAQVDVVYHDRLQRYQVRGHLLRIPKHDPQGLSSALKDARGRADLALITCDGPFDQTVGASAYNSIVLAVRSG